ncbi:uncharacterized protein LOC112161484 isoform X2 [Oryzias melastigma]|uniref:uncharacterized protein LOC112161484 isoform X2 n=1 Tax=Oryzias melastigma TaxID=30732 RepID=UPI000CF80CDE|nr:uncharacterized protein LOC112161484 isoform X2 [Oryzias melastigma]
MLPKPNFCANTEMQQSFAQRMDGAFISMLRCYEEHRAEHSRMLSSCSQAIDGLITMNEEAVKGAMTTMESFVGGVRSLVSEGVGRFQEELQQHEALCLQDKESLLQLLEEYRQDMEDVLITRTLMDLTVVKELCDSLKSSVETQRALASQVEAMKEVGGFLGGLVQELVGLRQTAVLGLDAVQAGHDKLEKEIQQVQERQQASMKDTIQCLQNQLTLLSMQVLTKLHSASRALQTPVLLLQESISSGCSSVEDQLSGRAQVLHSSSSIASSLRLTADENLQLLTEMDGYSSVSGLVERDLQWSLRARQHADRQNQELLAVTGAISTEAQAVQQSVQTLGSEQVRTAEEQLSEQQQDMKQALKAVQKQSSDWTEDELQQDVPTGLHGRRDEHLQPKFGHGPGL